MSKNEGGDDDLEQAERLNFSASMEELTEIVQRIEDDQTDIDGLAAALHRASQLLEFCRGKIRKVDLEVSQIVQQLDATEGDSAESSDDGSTDG